MRILTKREEITILKMLDIDNNLGYGSSRFVLECPVRVYNYLSLDKSVGYVIKLAIGHGGFNQHQREVEMWTEFHNKNFLAEIVAAGQFISIMEEVEVDDYTDFAEYISDYWDYSAKELAEKWLDYDYYDESEASEFDRNVEVYTKVAETIMFLAAYNGDTSDNGQLGWTKDGRCVAYDYGFISGQGCESQCSNDLVDNVVDTECFNYYINELTVILEEMADTEDKLNNLCHFITAVEYTINSGDWEQLI